MTALEYMQKRLERHRKNLEGQTKRGAPEIDLEYIRAKIEYYTAAVDALRKVGEKNA